MVMLTFHQAEVDSAPAAVVPLPCAFFREGGQCFTLERHPALQQSMKGCNHGDSAAVAVCLNNEMSYE